MKPIVLAAVVLAAVGAAEAQPLDSRWSPWLGCWQLSGENVRVCVAPASDNRGVTLTTIVATTNDPVLAQTIVADGMRHQLAEAECTGWQQADWSRTGERLFASAELSCRDGGMRKVTGLSMIAPDGTWFDIQGIEIAGRENVRVRRYRRAADRAGAAASTSRLTAVAPRLGATALTIDDVREASGRVSPRVLEAAIAETRASFDLTSRALLDLDRAGVADSVIDTMVALSYPRHFVVDRPAWLAQESASLLPGFDIDDTYFGAWPFPYYRNYWNRYSVFSPYLYSPFGYGYWASYGGYYYYPYSFFSGGGGPALDVADGPSGDGRAVNGLGYTRIRTRAEVDAQAEAGRRRTDSGVSAGQSSPRGDSSSGGSAGVSSSGFSSGSSSTDTGRTAQPR